MVPRKPGPGIGPCTLLSHCVILPPTQPTHVSSLPADGLVDIYVYVMTCGSGVTNIRSGRRLVCICNSMVGSQIWDKYHEYCSGSGKVARGEAQCNLLLPLQYEWYLSQISRPTMLSYINTIQPHSSLPSGTRTRTQHLLLGGWALIRETRSQGL